MKQEVWTPPPPPTPDHDAPAPYPAMEARVRLINTTSWWGGGAFPGDRGDDPRRWQAMAWAVLMRRASLHACARHEAAVQIMWLGVPFAGVDAARVPEQRRERDCECAAELRNTST